MSDVRNHAPGSRGQQVEVDLEDALHELISTGEQPDADALEEIVARHPRHAADLTDFAVEWALQELLPEAPESAEAKSAVPAAMKLFQARVAELETTALATVADGEAEAARKTASDPFADRTPAELKRVAAALGLDKTLLAKLRDRKIVAETIPARLREGLAAAFEVPAAIIAAHLSRPAAVHAGLSFKAAGKPEAGPKETFAEAVRRSFLDADDKDRWLADGAADPTAEADPADG